MKKLILAFFCLGNFFCQAQNVGIGTNSPNARLHVATTASQVIQIEGSNPYISFFNGSDYRGYLWYNANKMELGTPSGSTEPVLIAPGRVATAYFTTAGRMGLGLSAPTERLDVNGNINLNGLLKINGSAGSTGQVLTSNGSGDPEWKDAAFNNNTRFCFSLDEIVTGISGLVDFPATRYNLNTTDVVRNPNNITINKTGLYHFDLNLNIFVDYDSGVTPEPGIYLEFSINGILYEVFQGTSLADERNSADYRLNRVFSIDLHITAPTTITLPYSLYTSGTPVGKYILGQLAGYLISE